jgi:hypothetical protein
MAKGVSFEPHRHRMRGAICGASGSMPNGPCNNISAIGNIQKCRRRIAPPASTS